MGSDGVAVGGKQKQTELGHFGRAGKSGVFPHSQKRDVCVAVTAGVFRFLPFLLFAFAGIARVSDCRNFPRIGVSGDRNAVSAVCDRGLSSFPRGIGSFDIADSGGVSFVYAGRSGSSRGTVVFLVGGKCIRFGSRIGGFGGSCDDGERGVSRGGRAVDGVVAASGRVSRGCGDAACAHGVWREGRWMGVTERGGESGAVLCV